MLTKNRFAWGPSTLVFHLICLNCGVFCTLSLTIREFKSQYIISLVHYLYPWWNEAFLVSCFSLFSILLYASWLLICCFKERLVYAARFEVTSTLCILICVIVTDYSNSIFFLATYWQSFMLPVWILGLLHGEPFAQFASVMQERVWLIHHLQNPHLCCHQPRHLRHPLSCLLWGHHLLHLQQYKLVHRRNLFLVTTL